MATPSPAARLDTLRIRHFELIQKLAEFGSLRQAAEALHVSQPAASAMLKEAEARLGVELFHRSRSGVVPTAEAEPVIRRVRFLLGEVRGLSEDLQDSRKRRPLVRIGAVPHAMLGVMQDFAAHWSGKEGVRLRLEDGPTSALVEKLLRGELDAIVAPLTPEAGTAFTSSVRSRPLYEETIVVAASVRNPLAKAKNVSLDDLEKADWVLPGAASRSRQALEGEFLRLGRKPPMPAVEVTSFVYGLALVGRTSMLTVAPATAINKQNKEQMVIRLTTQIRPPPFFVHWISRRDSDNNKLLEDIGNHLAMTQSKIASR
ncbi:MAG TPA: LysR family transcriptional regulator [Usitatibacteraceae bacterium]|nr:LysR family transcriptional regulator [Usitatibacteraceae bacterium]